jgi:elongation factor 1-gamma
MSTTLYSTPGQFRSFKALIASEYNSFPVEVEDFTAEHAALSPLGKAPVLQTPQGVIFESNAIARYIARTRRDTELMGATFVDQGLVDSWVDFGAHEIELPASMWTYPVLGYMPFNLACYTKAKADLAKSLTILNAYLLDKTYLVGDKVTLADIAIVSALVYPMKLVCDKAYLKPFTNVVRWFNTCVNQPEFKNVIGECNLAKEEMLAPGAPAAPKKEEKPKAEKKPKAKKPKDDDEDDEPAAPAAPKAEHPYKIMDREAPSPFVMDQWKKTYSNAKSYKAAMAAFWETYDQKGWSIWHMNYQFNHENSRVFMACNAITGFHQRSDEVRKWAFGVQDLLGTEDTVLEVKGIWLFRGDTVDHLKTANDDANWYDWTKLAGQELAATDEVKAQIFAYWCSEETLEDKPIQDSKVFK